MIIARLNAYLGDTTVSDRQSRQTLTTLVSPHLLPYNASPDPITSPFTFTCSSVRETNQRGLSGLRRAGGRGERQVMYVMWVEKRAKRGREESLQPNLWPTRPSAKGKHIARHGPQVNARQPRLAALGEGRQSENELPVTSVTTLSQG